MDLVIEYLHKVALKENEKMPSLREKYYLYENEPEKAWYRALRSKEKTIAIAAGRRTGKTRFVFNRIAQGSERRILVLTKTPFKPFKKEFKNHLGDFAYRLHFNEPRIYFNEKLITYFKANDYLSPEYFDPMRYTDNELVIIEEPEMFDTFMIVNRSFIRRMCEDSKVICVGSFRHPLESQFKHFFRNADFKQIINAPYFEGAMPAECDTRTCYEQWLRGVRDDERRLGISERNIFL